MNRGRRSFRPVFRRETRTLRDAGRDVDDELEFHLDEVARELEAEGWEPAEARREAERRFGDLDDTRRYCARQAARAANQGGRRMWIDEMWQDLKWALRTSVKSPVYAGIVVTTLAVGIALNTLVFSFINPYLLRPLPYDDPDRLVHLGGVDRLQGWDMGRFSAPQIADIGAGARSLDEVAGYYYGTVNLTGDAAAERIQAAWVTGGLFGLLGVDASRGRLLGTEDDRPGATDVVVLGHGLWERRYGADAGVVGSTVRIDGAPHTVVGIARAEFNFPFNAIQLWLPMRADPAREDRAAMGTLAVARLADGMDRGSAEADLAALHAELARLHPDEDGRYAAIALHPLRESLNFAWDILQPAFLLLLVGVGLVLVIACVNVASLTLARASVRGREVAVRAAVGAGRSRIVRQLLVESVVLAAVGGAAGLLLAWVGTGAVGALLPSDLYRVGDVDIDGRVLAFSVAVTLLAPAVFGLAPALGAVRRDLAEALKAGSAGGGGSRRALRSRRFLVVGQVALAVVLVTATGLMVRSLQNALAADLGFAADRLLIASMTPSEADAPDAQALAARYAGVVDAVRAVPGVEAVATVSHLPLNHETFGVRVTTPDATDLALEQRPTVYTSRAGTDYFETLAIGPLQGRTFTAADADDPSHPVVISRAMAERLWPGRPALGRTLVWGTDAEGQAATVVGIVEDVRWDDLAGAPVPHLYRPLDGSGTRRRFMVIRARDGTTPAALTGPVRSALMVVDPDTPVDIRPMTDIVRESTGAWAISSIFLGVFGVVALALAALGIYGLIAFSVAQRRREMGLRLALGADVGTIRRAIVGDGLRLTAVGLAIGVALASLAALALSSQLFGVAPLDPVSLGAAVVLFAAVAFVSSARPAWRAGRVDPVEVLRSE